MSDEIEEGDQFIVNDTSGTDMEITENKVYTCTSASSTCVYFLDDKGNPDFHVKEWFTKVPKTDYQVGDLVTLSDTGSCYTTHFKAAEWGLTNYFIRELPHTDRPHTITGIFKCRSIIYSLEDEQGNQYLSGSRYFDHVFKKPKSATGKDLLGKTINMSGKLTYVIKEYNRDTKNLCICCHNTEVSNSYFSVHFVRTKLDRGAWNFVEEPEKPKSEGADDLIGKRFINKGHLIEIQDPAYDHYKVHMYYVNSPEKSWDVSITSIRSWIAEGVLEPVEESVPVPAELPEIPQWQSYNPQTEEYDCKQPELAITGSVILKGSINLKEENQMNKTNTIQIEVPNTAYIETTVVTMYGHIVDATNEANLHTLLARINKEQDELKAVNKTAKSSRITGQINKLGSARTKVVEMLDALPEE